MKRRTFEIPRQPDGATLCGMLERGVDAVCSACRGAAFTILLAMMGTASATDSTRATARIHWFYPGPLWQCAALPLTRDGDVRCCSCAVEDHPEPDAPMPEVLVQAESAVLTPPGATHAPCGLGGLAALFAHPAVAWRELLPLPPTSDVPACLRANTIGEDIPEALGPMRWYQ